MNYYVQTDTNGFVKALTKDQQDDYTLIFVPDAWEDNFVRYFDKFRVNDQGVLTNPGNLPEVTLSNIQDELSKTSSSASALSNTISAILQNQVADSAKLDSVTQLASLVSTLMAKSVNQ